MDQTRTLFGSELRRLRDEAGLSQEELGKKLCYAKSTIAALEIGQRFPVAECAQRCDELFEVDGLLSRIRAWELRAKVLPEWFRKWPIIEEQATIIRDFDPLVVPGLLQTPDYARTLLRDDDRVAARLARQAVLNDEKPPRLVALIDEAVLRRDVGGPAVMREQLRHLADPPAPACVRILPFGADTYFGVDGPFVLATVDGNDCMYVETPARGFVLDDPELVSNGRERWEALLGEALPERQSRDLIVKVGEELWTTVN